MSIWNYSSKLYSIIVFVTISIVGILFFSGVIDGKDIGTASLALIGTLLGATIAFRLNEDKEKKLNEEKQIQAINSALLIIIRQYNALKSLEKEFKNYSNDIQAAINLPAIQLPDYNDLNQNISSLEFLINSKDPSILFKIIIEQERFHQAIASWQVRNDFYLNKFQPIVSEKNLNRQSFSLAQSKMILGDIVVETLINSVINSKDLVIKSCETLPIAFQDLRKIARELYPNQRFLEYKINE